jgi:hypothetical protein
MYAYVPIYTTISGYGIVDDLPASQWRSYLPTQDHPGNLITVATDELAKKRPNVAKNIFKELASENSSGTDVKVFKIFSPKNLAKILAILLKLLG